MTFNSQIGLLITDNSIYQLSKAGLWWKQKWFDIRYSLPCLNGGNQSSTYRFSQGCDAGVTNKTSSLQFVSNYLLKDNKYMVGNKGSSFLGKFVVPKLFVTSDAIDLATHYKLTLAQDKPQSFYDHLALQAHRFEGQNSHAVTAIEKILSPPSHNNEADYSRLEQFLADGRARSDALLPQRSLFPKLTNQQKMVPVELPVEYRDFSHKSVFSNSLDTSYDMGPNLAGALRYTEDTALNGNYSAIDPEPLNPVKPSVDRKFQYVMAMDFFDERVALTGGLTYMIRQNPVRDIKIGDDKFFIQRDKQIHQSAEIGGKVKLMKNWQVLTSLAYGHASIVKDSEDEVVGNTPRKSPRWKFKFRNQLDVTPMTGFAMFFDTDYKGVRPGDDLNTYNLPPELTVGIGFGYKRSWKEDRISIATEVTDLFGASYVREGKQFEMLDRIPDSLKLTFNCKF